SGEKTATGKRVHYTKKDKNVYAIFLDWPGGPEEKTTQQDLKVALNQLTQKNLNAKVKKVTLLGLKKLEDIPFQQTKQGLNITIPAKTRVPSELAHVFRVELE